MIIVMNAHVSDEQIQKVLDRIAQAGLRPHLSHGENRTIIGVVGDGSLIAKLQLFPAEGVEKTIPVTTTYKLASREFRTTPTTFTVKNIEIGGSTPVIMAGPCAVESLDQLLESAHIVKEAGAHFLRGGAFKPRTSPYSFQGLEEQGLQYLAQARETTGLGIVTEVVDTQSVDLVAHYADMLQIGARNMQNFQLLKKVGQSQKPVLLKRGISATIQEWLQAAEYILNEGNPHVLLCERGIRTFEEYTRNTLDLSAITAIKELSHLPVIVDPSHATGRKNMVGPMSRAALAAGADGLMIEVHPNPSVALSDGPQSLTPGEFSSLMTAIRRLAHFLQEESA